MKGKELSTGRIAVVLAAGQGTRLRSGTPKVLHRAGGAPLLAWVLEAARAAGCKELFVVVGHGAEQVERAFAAPDTTFVQQSEQRGTGDAVARVEPLLEDRRVLALVLSGDAPLVRSDSLQRLLEAAERGWGAIAVAEVPEPGSLGRVLSAPDGRLQRIVEAADATEEELANRLVNAGHYALPLPDLFAYLARLQPTNEKGELYLTDALGEAAAEGRSIECCALSDAAEAWGVNDRKDLVRVHRELRRRNVERLLAGGVTLLDPESTTVEAGVEVAPDTVVHGGVCLLGATKVGEGCELHQGVWIRDSILAEGVEVGPYSVLDGAAVGNDCRIGPFARLRPGAELERDVQVGNFVEVKKSHLGAGVKANHLAYLGDAEVGAGSNIGAGAVTCNYDGERKHRTEIGEGVFVGSDTMLVAPVKVGDGALTAAGSVITKDVPAGALAVGRAKQTLRPGWALERRRRKTTSS